MDWYPTLSGVKQGDSGSPTIFAYFINDLAEGFKTLNKGVQFNNDILCCLFYADDIVLLYCDWTGYARHVRLC
jgi:hypothetical protein